MSRSLNSFYDTSVTRLRINGVVVDPNEVAVDFAADAEAEDGVLFEMEISKVVLQHELEESDFAIEPDELKEFVARDLESDPKETCSFCLEIVRGVTHAKERKGSRGLFGSLFAKRLGRVDPKWLLRRVDRVMAIEDRIALSGLAKRAQMA